mgnify:CR=1 FL=1
MENRLLLSEGSLLRDAGFVRLGELVAVPLLPLLLILSLEREREREPNPAAGR